MNAKTRPVRVRKRGSATLTLPVSPSRKHPERFADLSSGATGSRIDEFSHRRGRPLISLENQRQNAFALIASPLGSITDVVTFQPSPLWEPYVDALLARKGAIESPSDPLSTSERKTGLVRINPPSLALTADCHIHVLRRAA